MRYDRIKPETVVEKHISVQNRRKAFKQGSTDPEEPRVSQKVRLTKFLSRSKISQASSLKPV